MEVLIKNHRPRDKTEKRKKKREKEQEVLNLFRAEGERLRKTYPAGNITKIEGGETEKQSEGQGIMGREASLYPCLKAPGCPPPYPSLEGANQCPVIRGIMK